VVSRSVIVQNALGMHARAAAAFVKTAMPFEAEIEIPAGRRIIAGHASITADNGFELRVSGAAVLRGEDFRKTFDASIANLLRPGKNAISVRAWNGGDGPNPAALIARIAVELEGGARVVLSTGDAAWRAGS